MDSEAQRTPDAESRRITLSKLADYLESQRDAVTEQWLLAVRRDPNIATADRLTHQQLVDHLPAIYQECCEFLRRRDTSVLVDDAQADAREHGEFRWQNGYRIEELIRELECFRRILVATVLRFVDVDARFGGTLERQASALVHQFFGEVTVNSVKQFVGEQQAVVASYTDKMQGANLELAQMNSMLQQALNERDGLNSVVAHELRNLLQSLTMAARIWEGQPSAEQAGTLVREQIRDLEQLLSQLLEQSSLADPAASKSGQVDLAVLHAQLMQQYRGVAEKKGITLRGELSAGPLDVFADVAKIKMLAESLLSHALKHTMNGEVALSFSLYDAERWAMCVSDTGLGLTNAATEQLFGAASGRAEGVPRLATGLTIVRGLIATLGGSLQVTTQAGTGTRIEVVLPCGTAPRPATS
jgi:signal transduction histidine kinase